MMDTQKKQIDEMYSIVDCESGSGNCALKYDCCKILHAHGYRKVDNSILIKLVTPIFTNNDDNVMIVRELRKFGLSDDEITYVFDAYITQFDDSNDRDIKEFKQKDGATIQVNISILRLVAFRNATEWFNENRINNFDIFFDCIEKGLCECETLSTAYIEYTFEIWEEVRAFEKEILKTIFEEVRLTRGQNATQVTEKQRDLLELPHKQIVRINSGDMEYTHFQVIYRNADTSIQTVWFNDEDEVDKFILDIKRRSK